MQMLSIWSDHPELEYLDGQPHPKVSPKRTHGLVQRAFLRVLERCAVQHGDFAPEWRFDLGAVDKTDTEFIPDIGFISYERLNRYSDAEAEEPPCAPDLAIEIRSPSSRPAYIRVKVDRYLKTGSTMVLDVDPARRIVNAHTIEGMKTYAESERFAHDALPWLVFDVGEIFPKPREHGNG